MPTATARAEVPRPPAPTPVLCRGCGRALMDRYGDRAVRLGNVIVRQRLVYHCAHCEYVWEWRPGG